MKTVFPIKKLLFVLAIIYALISILHFGIFYEDTDKMITNIVLAGTIFLLGYLIERQLDTERDVKAIDEKLRRLETSFISHAGGKK